MKKLVSCRFWYDYAIPLQVSKDMLWNPNVFIGYPTRGNACALSIPCHKQYPFDSLD